jgi:membrane-bound lytic murein transglycosylase A
MSFPWRSGLVVLAPILGILAACTTLGGVGPAGHETAPTPPALVAAGPAHPHARWVPARFADLPGWRDDPALQLWPALREGCGTPAPGWATVCAQALLYDPRDDAEARAWLEERLDVFQVQAPDGADTGLATGYFEPLVEARRRSGGAFLTPLWGPPADFVPHRPWFTREEIAQLPQAQAALRGREIAWVADPLDALLLQVQGSGRLHVVEPDGTDRVVRLAFAGNNEQPYKSVGRWLVDQGELRATDASWPAIRDWARRNPRRLDELLRANPRVVFFREEPLPEPTLGPRGAQGAPLTPRRSIAVDPQAVPFGSMVWLDTSEPLSSTPLQRLVMAQDTGSAITGAVRADFFWGWGETAEAEAGRMKQPLRMWVLWPRTDA